MKELRKEIRESVWRDVREYIDSLEWTKLVKELDEKKRKKE